MQKLIKNILAPIGAGKQSASVAERAIRMANHFQCSLHLLYTGHAALMPIFSNADENDSGNSRKKLSAFEDRFGPLLDPVCLYA